MKAQVYILMGSDSDLPAMQEAEKVLQQFAVSCCMHIASAHRSPEKVLGLVKQAENEGAKVIIAGAGFAAHLAGVIAGHTVLPVIGVPLASSTLQGLDSLLSTVQMPSGIPVASMAIGPTGAKNAAVFALEILATSDAHLQQRLKDYRMQMQRDIEAKDTKLQGK